MEEKLKELGELLRRSNSGDTVYYHRVIIENLFNSNELHFTIFEECYNEDGTTTSSGIGFQSLDGLLEWMKHFWGDEPSK